MSTHNICFCGEIRKISAFFGWKKRLICCYDWGTSNEYPQQNVFTLNIQSTLKIWTSHFVCQLVCLGATEWLAKSTDPDQKLHSTVSDVSFFFFFFFDLGFTALSRIFHLYRADRSSKVGENRRTRRKTTWPSVSRTWLSHIWPEPGSNHSGEKPNGSRVNSLIH